jgi:cellulose synthase/poly-beta-1,6-N-acetylglucosamine synthase-like glycosyltransferase
VISEANLSPVGLRKVVVVASDCSESVISELESVSEEESMVQLLVEDRRHGKADAINKIQASAAGRLLVMLNADASPESGAITRLVSAIDADRSVGAVSALPVVEGGNGATSLLLDFMWTTHNDCSVALNHMNISNHSCDELVVFRSSAIRSLPDDLVNDGAFLAAIARQRGYSVKVHPVARVKIETPTRISDVIRQRRRILFGHTQVWRKVGRAPKTIESLLLLSPRLGLRLLIGTLARRPRFLFAIPLAFICELSASLLSIYDTIRATHSHSVWRRFN